MKPVSNYISFENNEIHVTQWGSREKPTIILWHGLARTGRDFDSLAEYLSDDFFILCPDTLGRGLSGWAETPEKQYCFEFYEKIAFQLFEEYEIDQCIYIGTSMGGALGMRLAAGPLKDNINALVINDIAPELAPAAVNRIVEYVSKPPTFAKITELEAYLRTVYSPYGYMTNEQWRLMTETSSRRLSDGSVTLHYDPNITQQFISHADDYDLWDSFLSIKTPILILRGINSDLFLSEWAEKMNQSGDHIDLIEIENCGHAPALNTPEQHKYIFDFINNNSIL